MSILQLIVLLLASVDVRVDLLDGSSVAGTLTSIGTDELVLQADGDTRAIALADVVMVEAPNVVAQSADTSSGEILLSDSSQVPVGIQQVSAKEVLAESAATGALKVPRSAVRAVRLAVSNSDWQDQWQAYLKRDNTDDLLILKKRDGSGLDFYGGVVSGVTDDKVDFVLDGDPVPVPRDRVYGLVFAAQSPNKEQDLIVSLADSSRLVARSIQVDTNELQLTTSWGQSLSLPLDCVRSLDFSSGRFHYLSDLKPIKETYFGIHPEGSLLEDFLKTDDELGEAILNLWKLHRDEVPMGPFGPLPLTLRGKVYRKGVWLFPSCRIDYPLDGRYSTFQTMAGVDDEVAFNCSRLGHPSKVELTVLIDGDEVWSELIEAPADPVSIALNVEGVRTLSIVVGFGDDDSACDYLDLADARLLVVQ